MQGAIETNNSFGCISIMAHIMIMMKGLNRYDLFRPLYTDSALTEETRYESVEVDGQLKTYKKGHSLSEYAPWLGVSKE
jgi:hypothetical protein